MRPTSPLLSVYILLAAYTAERLTKTLSPVQQIRLMLSALVCQLRRSATVVFQPISPKHHINQGEHTDSKQNG